MPQTTDTPATEQTAADTTTEVIAYKGFDKDLRCRGYQYEIGKTHTHEGRVAACSSGLHSCENPFDVWPYYPLGDGNRFCIVKAGGKIARHGGDSKLASATLFVEAELSLPEFIGKAVDWVIAATKVVVGAVTTEGLNDNGEDDAQIGSSGNGAQIGSSGNGAQIGSSGYGAQIGSSGYGAQIGSSGNGAQIGSSGYGARIDSSGERAVIAAAGVNTVAKGVAGTWMSLPEFMWNDSEGRYDCVGFATGCIGQGGLEPDTFYRAKGGKLVAA